jgi:drug/metabolite transporter (DMT)-like permease
MTGTTVVGVAAAAGAGALFELSYVVQALEARSVPQRTGNARLGLLGTLARRRRWLAAMAASAAAFGLQVLALAHAPLSLVQPVLALGLVVLLVLSHVVLHEAVGRRQVAAAAGILAGVTLLAVAGPQRTGDRNAAALAVAVVVLGAVLVLPLVRRRVPAGALVAGATAGDALAALAVNEAASALSGSVVGVVLWAGTAAVAGLLALTAETEALQRRPASVVAPVVLGGQVAIPVLLAPVVAGESWAGTPGGGVLVVAGLLVVVTAIVFLARSPAIVAVRRVAEPVSE